MKIIDRNNIIQTIGFRELRENADDIVAGVKQGKSYLVKRKSESIFRIVPVEEEAWNTVIDFTEVDKKGVLIDDVIGAIENTKQENKKRG